MRWLAMILGAWLVASYIDGAGRVPAPFVATKAESIEDCGCFIPANYGLHR